MGFAGLALVSAVALLGPLLATPRRGHLPVLLGELIAGIALGRAGLGVLDAADDRFTFLADIGFVLVMFVAGTHVPVRDGRLRRALRAGTLRALTVGVLAVPVALAIAFAFGTGHAALYGVLLASSSAALVLPVVQSSGADTEPVLELLAQVAVADAACIVALPLAVDPAHAWRAALGAAAIVAAAGALYVALRQLERSGLRKRAHRASERRKLALELRVSLALLFALAALARFTHVSVLLAGFCAGLAVAAVGEPRRLARQLFAVTEGFLGPLFFVWFGAALDLRGLAGRPSLVLLGAALGFGALAVHLAMRATGQPLWLGALAATQLGVPVAAATVGTQLGVLAPGEAAALVLGALITVAASALAGSATGQAGRPARR